MSYSEALEQQIGLGDWLNSDDAKEWFDACNEVGRQSGPGREGWTSQTIDYHLKTPAYFGECFYWSADITDALIVAGESLPPDTSLSSDLLPAHHGFVWLEKPMSDKPDQMTALLWTTQALPDGNEPEVVITPIVRMPPNTRYAGVPLGGINWLIGDSLQSVERRLEQTGGYGLRKAVRTWLASLLFVQQRIAAASPTPVNRLTARRLNRRRLGPTAPLVTVIELRRRESANRVPDKESRQDVAWTHQWVVSGHWHHYHTHDGLQPRWVMPYVKGPEDKPLKSPRGKVFAVVR
jgi:hypothetical protein